MYRIRLIKGASYTDGRITATKTKPEVVVDDLATAEHYQNTGFFATVGEEVTSGKVASEGDDLFDGFWQGDEDNLADRVYQGEDEAQEVKAALISTLSQMNVDDLKTYAKQRGVEISGITKKADLVEHIATEQLKADEARKQLRGE